MTSLIANGVGDEDIIALPDHDCFDDLLNNLPAPVREPVCLSNVPADKRYTYEYNSEITGFSVEQLKSSAVFELFIPINPRPKTQHVADVTNTRASPNQNGLTFTSNQFNNSPTKYTVPSYHVTPSLRSFGTPAVSVPKSPAINIFEKGPTHSTPSLGGATATNVQSLTMTVTKSHGNEGDVCKMKLTRNRTICLDRSALEQDDDGSLSPPPTLEGRGEKLNRTFTKADIIQFKNGIVDRTVTRSNTESDDESLGGESSASQSDHQPIQESVITTEVVTQTVVRSTSAGAASQKPVSQIPGPFTSRLMQPKVYSYNQGSASSLGGSASSVASASSVPNNHNKASRDLSSAAAPPPALTRAGTFTKDTGRTAALPNGQVPRKQSIGSVLPNKMSAPMRTSVAPARRNHMAGGSGNAGQSSHSSINVHAYRYPNASSTANLSRPGTGTSRRTMNSAR